MANTTFGDISPRTAAYVVKDLLERALPDLIIEQFGQNKPLPARSTKTLTFRKFNPLDTTPQALVEGVTPSAKKMTVTDVSLTLVQYGDRITVTDVIQDTHEDPVLQEGTEIISEQAAQMIERVRYGVIRAGTNVAYANGTTRTAVNTPITLNLQRKITRALKNQNTKRVTRAIAPTPKFNTRPVAPAFICMCHPNCEADIRGLAGFTPVEEYGSGMTPYASELGKVEDVRYVTSTMFVPFEDGGGAYAGSGTSMLTTSGTSADVYPMIFTGANAYACVALRGKFAITPMVVNAKPSDSDPLAQRNHVGWKTMQGAIILYDLYMCRAEVAVTAL